MRLDSEQVKEVRQLLKDQDKRIRQRFKQNDKAVERALTNLIDKQADQNEWRTSMKDYYSTLVTRAEVERDIEQTNVRLTNLETFQNNVQGSKTQTIWIVGLLLTIAAIVVAVIYR